ncbi:NAD(P)/FAD-dependent oxidoreductase [Hansschlegelia quercus]|uniref:NAD(P)/FAD-dependent oxidoreductase n=1 Tax=Hansschlegelia quercus TaxID=2528245 RepID=UPI0013EF2BB9|nr:FAD-dependent oxidoreductase [Hansschlegelia quercus]
MGQSPAEAYDIVIVGGGVRALAIALGCASRGPVALFAEGEIAAAADERAWPVVRSAHSDLNRLAAEARAPKRLKRLVGRLPGPVARDAAGVLALASSQYDVEALTAAAGAAKAAGVAAWMVPPLEVSALSPPLGAGRDVGAALYEPGALTVDADALAFALADAAAQQGAALFAGAPVERLERDDLGVAGVIVGGRLIAARRVMLADDFAAIRLVRENRGRLSLKREERQIIVAEPGGPSLGPALLVGDLTLSRDIDGAITLSGPFSGNELARRAVEAAPSLSRLVMASEEPVTVWTGVDGRAQVGAADIPGLWLSLGFGRDALSGAVSTWRDAVRMLADKPADLALAPFAPTRRPTREVAR